MSLVELSAAELLKQLSDGEVTAVAAATAYLDRIERLNPAVNAFVRYIDSYMDDEVDLGQGSTFFRSIDSQTTVDAQYVLRLRAAKAPTLTFGAINLFDEEPPRVRTSGGYDSKVHDPRGRMFYAKALFRF